MLLPVCVRTCSYCPQVSAKLGISSLFVYIRSILLSSKGEVSVCLFVCLFPVALRPNADHGLLIHEVS
jgi:hypothetical protein